MLIELFKHKRRIICYIRHNETNRTYSVCTGKPSENGFAWTYNNMEDARKTALEFYNNYTSILK